MTAEQIIEELKIMDSVDGLKIREFLDTVTESEIPPSFWQGLREADEGKAMEIKDEHFDNPPA